VLATIVQDAYRVTEKSAVSSALHNITEPRNGNWSSAGVYSFWDYHTKEILYLGLAVDLAQRFDQHNGETGISSVGSKSKEIRRYFESHEKLGYSIILQSALSQPITRKLKDGFPGFFSQPASAHYDVGEDGRNSIRRMEGILIESYRSLFGRFPAWNKVGGSAEGQRSASPKNYPLLKILNTSEINKFVSRVSLRELAENSEYNSHEAYLHSVRIMPSPSTDAINLMSRMLGENQFEVIRRTGYFSKRLAL